MKCPNQQCRKRVCDVGMAMVGMVVVELKCPRCGRIVRVIWKPKKKSRYT